MDITMMKVIYSTVCLSLLSDVALAVVDQAGYDKYENRVCDASALANYNHSGSVAMVVSDCTTACKSTHGCIAFSVDLLDQTCKMFASCDTRVEHGVYCSYVAVYCGSPPGIANARPTVNIFYYNYDAAYQCLAGYSMVGTDAVACDADGSWSGSAPTCEYDNYYRCKDHCEVGATFTCPSGYVLDIIYANYGFTTGRECTPVGSPADCLNYESNDVVKTLCNGQNSCNLEAGDALPTGGCVGSIYYLTEFKCVEPSRGSIDTCFAQCATADAENSQNTLLLTDEGAQRDYTCDEGYEISLNVTTETVPCDEGTIDGRPPTCAPINCPEITLPNGNPSTVDTEFQTSVTFTCDEGYNFVGDSPVTCDADKTWSGTWVCEPVDCETFSSDNADIDFSGGTHFPLSVMITCHTGYELTAGADDHSISSSCQTDGSWSDESGCIIKDCSSPPSMDPNGSINFVANTVTTTYGEELEYFCDEGFLPPDKTIQCNEDGDWDGTHTCTAVQCPDVSGYDFVTNHTATNGRAYMSVAMVTCDEGYEFLADSTATCEQDEEWVPTIVCQKKNCGQPGDVENSASVDVTDTLYGDTVKYTCDSGHEVSDGVVMATITCQTDGTWSTKPTCAPIQCAVPTSFGFVSQYTSTDDRFFLSVATISCDEGYEFLPDSTTSCKDDKQWNPVIICKKKDCGQPGDVDNAAPVTVTDTLFMDTVVYNCDTGHEVSDGIASATITCAADGMWPPKPACERVDCGDAPINGNHGLQVVGGTKYNDIITYSCEEGHKFIPDVQEVNRCTASGNWLQPTASNCEIMDCGVPNTVVEQGSAEYSGTTYGSSVTYTCNEGYLPSISVYYCDATETWNGTASVCEPVDCGAVSPTLENGNVVVEGTTYTRQATYTCNVGYLISGSTVCTCTAGSTWSDDPPTCLLINKVRVLTKVMTSLDCDDYSETSLAALLKVAKADLPSQLRTVLQSIPARQRLTTNIVIVGISPLQFLFEVIVENTEEISTTEQLLSNALADLSEMTVQLQVDGQNVNINLSTISPSVNTEKECEQGFYTKVDTLDCLPCPKDTYQPTGIQELCLACPGDSTTDAEGTHGDRDKVCKSGTSAMILGLSIGIPVGVILLLLLIIMMWCCVRKPRYSSKHMNEFDSQGEIYDTRKVYYGNPFHPLQSHDSTYNLNYPLKF